MTPKAFAISAQLSTDPFNLMPMELRHHWLWVDYHYGDLERTPVAGAPYRLTCQANPDIVFNGKTDAMGRIFVEQAAAGHYDLVLVPEPDAAAPLNINNTLKDLKLDLANIALQSQQQDQTSQISMAMSTFWCEFLDDTGGVIHTVTPWIEALQEITAYEEQPGPGAIKMLKELRVPLLLLSSDRSLKTALTHFIQQAGEPFALPLLTHILRSALSLPNTSPPRNAALAALCCSAANHLARLPEALKNRVHRTYARISVNQRHEVIVKPCLATPLAINHQQQSGMMNLLTWRDNGRGELDFSLTGHVPLHWIRQYREDDKTHTDKGPVWSHPFDTQLHIHKQHALVIHQGLACELAVPDIGCFTSHAQRGLLLYRDSRSRWLLKSCHQPIMTFLGDNTCRLDRITYSPGRFWQCEYAPDNTLLRRVHNSVGETLTLVYQHQKIQQIIYSGPQQGSRCLVRYDYDRVHDDRNPLRGSSDQQLSHQSVATTTAPNSANPASSTDEWDPQRQVLSLANASGNRFQYYFNDFGQLLTFLDPAGGGYNLLYNEQQLPVGFCDALGNTWECDYFSSGLIREIRFPSGLTYQYEYQGGSLPCAITINKQLRRTLIWRYDGVLLEDSEPPAACIQSPGPFDGFALHHHGALTYANQGTPADAHCHRDPMGRLLQKTRADGRRLNLDYNRNGQLTEVMTPEACVQIRYDKDGRAEDPSQDPAALLATLDSGFSADQGLPQTAPRGLADHSPFLSLYTPYTQWQLDRPEHLFHAFSHEGHQDGLFSWRLWQALQEKFWLPFIRQG